MDARSFRQIAFQPVTRALTDAWLQVRAKPLVYILIWLSLALAPYLIMGAAFSDSLFSAFEEFMAAAGDMGVASSTSGPLPEDFTAASIRIFGIYAVILGIVSLIGIYMGAVLSGTVRRFRNSTFPRYMEAMADGGRIFPGFFLAVLYAALMVLGRPLIVGVAGGVLAIVVGMPVIWTFAFFLGFFLFFSGLYRYGLAPFIHLSLGVGPRESCGISRSYHNSHRHVVSSLFLVLVLLPVIVLVLLFSMFLGSGLYFGAGSLILWFLQSALQFSIVMTLVNFAMNTFRPQDFGTGDVEAEFRPVDETGDSHETGPGTDA